MLDTWVSTSVATCSVRSRAGGMQYSGNDRLLAFSVSWKCGKHPFLEFFILCYHVFLHLPFTLSLAGNEFSSLVFCLWCLIRQTKRQSGFSVHHSFLGDLLKHTLLGSETTSFWFSRSGWSLRICISNKFSCNNDAAVPGSHFWELLLI